MTQIYTDPKEDSKENLNDEIAKTSNEIAKTNNEIAKFNSNIERLSLMMSRSNFEDTLANFSNPWRLIRINFLVGLSRGIGMTIGTALFLGILLFILGNIVTMPIIGEYIAELLEWIDAYRAF